VSQAIAKLVKERGFAIEHTFRAPAAKVFGAYTDPKLVPQWWAPKGTTMTVEAMDVRPGGAYRFVQRQADGTELVFVGKYLEVDPVTHLVYTFTVEGQGGEVTTTVDLRETPAGTVMTLTNVFASKEARDAAMQYGAEAGARSAMGALDAFLRRTAPVAGGARA
jgi:uncharacterized protein YndB with AHSA1/START domain